MVPSCVCRLRSGPPILDDIYRIPTAGNQPPRQIPASNARSLPDKIKPRAIRQGTFRRSAHVLTPRGRTCLCDFCLLITQFD